VLDTCGAMRTKSVKLRFSVGSRVIAESLMVVESPLLSDDITGFRSPVTVRASSAMACVAISKSARRSAPSVTCSPPRVCGARPMAVTATV
jgi:hypothetical protein